MGVCCAEPTAAAKSVKQRTVVWICLVMRVWAEYYISKESERSRNQGEWWSLNSTGLASRAPGDVWAARKSPTKIPAQAKLGRGTLKVYSRFIAVYSPIYSPTGY